MDIKEYFDNLSTKDIILFILVILVILLVVQSNKPKLSRNKPNNSIILKDTIDNFAQDEIDIPTQSITTAINYYYNEDILALKYLNSITKFIMSLYNNSQVVPTTSPETLVIPATTTLNGNLNVYNDLTITGNLTVTGNVQFKSNTTMYDILPSGVILAWYQAIPPPGWVVCDGNNGTPDLSYRFIITPFTSSNPFTNVLNNTLGEDSVKLIDEQAIHSHQYIFPVCNNPGDPADSGEENMGGVVTPATKLINTSEVGGGANHNNIPPYMILLYIMKK
jgi:hypothetical protein